MKIPNPQQLLDKNAYPIFNKNKPMKWWIFTKNWLIGSYEKYWQAKETAWKYAQAHNETTYLVQMHKKYIPKTIVIEENYIKNNKNL